MKIKTDGGDHFHVLPSNLLGFRPPLPDCDSGGVDQSRFACQDLFNGQGSIRLLIKMQAMLAMGRLELE